jgi:hypothetical protein
MKRLENMSFRPALRLGRRKIRVFLEGGKHPSRVWSNYSLARGIPAPVQKMPKVGHFSEAKGDRS